MAAVIIVRGGAALARSFVRLAKALGGKIKSEVKQKVKEKVAGPFEPEIISFTDIQEGKVALRAVMAAAEVIKGHAVALVPKDTGLLANSIRVQAGTVGKKLGISVSRAGATATVVTGTRAELQIGNSTKGYYPAAVEFGYRHGRGGNFIPAQPYLRPALYDHEAEILNIMKAEIKEGIFKVAKIGTRVLDVSVSRISGARPSGALNRLATRLVS